MECIVVNSNSALCCNDFCDTSAFVDDVQCESPSGEGIEILNI